MIEYVVDGKIFRIPDTLSDFQKKMYVHLIKWKWKHITKNPGNYEHKGEKIPYDAILPEDYVRNENMEHIYAPARVHLASHRTINDFRIHPHFYHMASSQAANINLFLTILHHADASAILARIKGAPVDFQSLDTTQFESFGYCLEFWGGNFKRSQSDRGPLNDKSPQAGTDSDLAIAYRNKKGEPCLWLIEHKLVEPEFTTCGGFKSKGRKDRPHCVCERSYAEILNNKNSCYYHDKCKYTYWTVTEANTSFFANASDDKECPFKGGMNQLWRNQLLGLAIENKGSDFKHVYFSVVRHPENHALDSTLKDYKNLIANNSKFSTFTSADVVSAAEQHADADLQKWITWYRELYNL